MNAENVLTKLYSGRILALASDIPHIGRLDNPSGHARQRSPLCGSTVVVDVMTDDHGRITDFAQDVKACALGQASASVVGANVIGLTRTDIQKGRAQLADMLAAGGPAPDAPFEDLSALMPATEFKNRHPSILLVFDALDAALAQTETQ